MQFENFTVHTLKFALNALINLGPVFSEFSYDP